MTFLEYVAGIKTACAGDKLISLACNATQAAANGGGDIIKTALVAHRKEAGLSQSGTYKRIGVPKRTLQDWERGVSVPPPYVLWLVLQELRK